MDQKKEKKQLSEMKKERAWDEHRQKENVFEKGIGGRRRNTVGF